MLTKYLSLFLLICLFLSCDKDAKNIAKPTLFSLKKASETQIKFNNELSYTEDFNPYVYRNFYNGAGVALGDINNDGLLDIYFTGNLVNNKLFLNKGNWVFEDISQKAGVECSDIWSTGATFADVNGDGLLDLYVCKSGKPEGKNRHNELFINNGDLTFTEKSESYGLNITGLSVQAAFFDYDKDGDLDCYLLNNSIKSIGGFDLIKDQRNIPSPDGNKLLQNNNGVFIDVSSTTGIYSSAIGFGLGITLSDLNLDSWPDLFISNDFFEKDYLYTNNQGISFSENSSNNFSSTSMGSMGADAADLNNDIYPEIMVTEMLPQTLERKKTKAIYESWDKYMLAEKKGYGNQLPRNVLQQNIGNSQFFEISRITGLDATEWSWSTLFFDMNNDGLKDVFISNGIYKDLLDRDYLNYMSEPNTIKNLMHSSSETIKKMIDVMPSNAVPNAAYLNKGNLQFKELADSLGLGAPSFSNGSVYGDLDNDGDLDLVVNNVNMPNFVYENTSKNNYIKIRFKGNTQNTYAIGAKVFAYYNNNSQAFYENFNSHGFQSSTAPEIVIGLGKTQIIDSLKIIWPNDQVSLFKSIKSDTTLLAEQSQADLKLKTATPLISPMLKSISSLFKYIHIENSTVDFKKEQLLDRMVSNEGPAFTSADINNDGKEDFYVGGAKNQGGQLFISSPTGYKNTILPFSQDKASEDTDAVFFDSDNDGDLDLYVASGGKAFSRFDTNLNDRLYINNGNSKFTKLETPLPFPKPLSTATVSVADIDLDGNMDIFIGERFNPEAYGAPSSGYILKNLGNNTFIQLEQKGLNDIGLITSSQWVDLNNDQYPDLIITGEWMPISIFINTNGTLINKTNSFGLNNSVGIWSSLKVLDIDNDGDQDIIAGNIGSNYSYKTATTLFFNDFDKNGKPESILCQKIGNKYYPILDKDELVSQLPYLKKKLLYYKDYAKIDMLSLFGETVLNQTVKYELNTTETSLFLNNNSNFTQVSLPKELQYSIVYAIETSDVNNDGFIDLLFGGNQDLIKPQFGKLDASKGWILFGGKDISSFTKTTPEILHIDGQIRNLKVMKHLNKTIIIATINNSAVNFYEYEK